MLKHNCEHIYMLDVIIYLYLCMYLPVYPMSIHPSPSTHSVLEYFNIYLLGQKSLNDIFICKYTQAHPTLRHYGLKPTGILCR